MSEIIYFCGRLDHRAATDPVVIRGYDLAGNLLLSIRYGAIPVTTESYVLSGFTRYRLRFPAVRASDGTAITAMRDVSDPVAGKPMVFPERMAAGTQGHIYVLSSSLEAIINETTNESALLYVDQVRKYDRQGYRRPFPSHIHNGTVRAIATDSAGNVYIGGDEDASEDHYILHKYDQDGTWIWSVSRSETTVTPYQMDSVFSIAIDASGNVYAGGGRPYGGGLLRKYNSSGVLQWTQRPAARPFYVALDEVSGSVFTSSAEYQGGYFLTDNYYVPWGVLGGWIGSLPVPELVTWFCDPYAQSTFFNILQWGMADGDYVVGVQSGLAPIIKYVGTTLYALCIWEGTSQFKINNYKKYDTDLTLLDDDERLATSFDADTSGNGFFAGKRKTFTGDSYALWHFPTLDSTGNGLWEGITATQADGVFENDGQHWGNRDWGSPSANAIYQALYASLEYTTGYGTLSAPDYPASVAGDWWIPYQVCVVESLQTASLPIPISLAPATTIGDLYSHASPLALVFAISPPSWIREFLGAFPPPTTYRCYLTGTPDLTLPMSSFQCRRSLDGLTQLTVVIPADGMALMDAIAARVAGDLVIFRGMRIPPSAVDQFDEMLRVSFSSVRYDMGTTRASLSITGERETTSGDSRTRTLRGVSYINQDGNRVRRVRCEVDTWLRPGDVAALGAGETLNVQEIVYWVSPQSAFMEVVED